MDDTIHPTVKAAKMIGDRLKDLDYEPIQFTPEEEAYRKKMREEEEIRAEAYVKKKEGEFIEKVKSLEKQEPIELTYGMGFFGESFHIGIKGIYHQIYAGDRDFAEKEAVRILERLNIKLDKIQFKWDGTM